MKLSHLAVIVCSLLASTTSHARNTWSIELNLLKFNQTFKSTAEETDRVVFQQVQGEQSLRLTYHVNRGRPYSDVINTRITPGVTCPGHSELIVSKEGDRYFIELDYEAIQLGRNRDGSHSEASHEIYHFKGEVVMTAGNWDGWKNKGEPATFVWTPVALQNLFMAKSLALKTAFTDSLNFTLRTNRMRPLVAREGFELQRLNTPEAYAGTEQSLAGTGMTYDIRYLADEVRRP